MMKLFVLLALVAVGIASAQTNTWAVLNSPKLLLENFLEFSAVNARHYTASEAPLRLRLFKKSLQQIATQNDADLGWTSGVNFFADMTEEEKQGYLGLNISMHHEELEDVQLEVSDDTVRPAAVNWIEQGQVTPVKNQGSCGSCWTFGSVVSVEGAYKREGGKLKNFAEQEYLDCVYTARNGCQGGWHTNCFDYSKNHGRLAITANYPYTAKDAKMGACDLSSVANGLIAAKITGYKIASTEDQHLQALTVGPTTVAFQVTNAFQMYKTGIIKDRTCHGYVNHAVAAVGYSEKYIIVKNSWGQGWGDEGFVKMGRGWSNCQLNKFVAYPLTAHVDGAVDSDPESPKCNYDPDANPGPTPGPDPTSDPNCQDDFPGWCRRSFCDKDVYREKLCRKTCGSCTAPDPTSAPKPTDDGTCPSGTIRCDDGVCRHEHMCK